MHELRPACGVLLLALGCAGAVQDAQDAGAASGIFCPAGDEYTGGRCLPICPSSQIRCDGYHCVDLKGDRANCGVCGNLCAAGLDCLEGQCLCPKGTTACDGVCIDLASDPAHCGTCGKACPSAASCIEGRCSAACSAVFPNGPTELSLSGSAYELWVGDFDGDGLTDVVGGGGNGPVQLWRGIGLREFAPPQILTGENLSSFAVGDFDGDGRLDVVASSNSGAGAILFFRSTPSGLAPAVIIAAGLTAVPVAADLNNDGRSDLLLVGEGTLQVMFSTPGGWSAPQIVDGGGAWVAVGDLNGDGLLDLVSGPAEAYYYAQTPGGGFAPGQSIGTQQSVAIADIDNDGRNEIVAHYLENEISVFAVDATGKLVQRSGPTVGPRCLPQTAHGVVADLDGDGNLDYAEAVEGRITFFRGDGSGGFLPPVEILKGYVSYYSAITDVDRDGLADVVTGDDYGPKIYFSAFSNPVHEAPIGNQILVADYDGDGRGDIAIGPYTPSLMLSRDHGEFSNPITLPPYTDLVVFKAGDKSGLAGLRGATLDLLAGDGLTQQGTPYDSVGLPWKADHVAAGDLNGDGRTDFAICHGGEVAVLLADSAGHFSTSIRPALKGCSFLEITDLDQTHTPYLVEADYETGSVRMFQLRANGAADQWDAAFLWPIQRLTIVDLDGDGLKDFGALLSNSSLVATLTQAAGHEFVFSNCSVGVESEAGFVSLEAADMNLDGLPDLVGLTLDKRVLIFLNQGGCQFKAADSIEAWQRLYALGVGDLDGDGAPDLVALGENGFQVFYNGCRWR